MTGQQSKRRELGASRKTAQGRLAAFLAEPLLLEEVGPPRIIIQLIFLIGFAIVGFIVWASITQLAETAKTTGQILPAGSIHVVQHLEGGIVEKILVRDGELVRQGQTLITLSSAAMHSELKTMKARRAALAMSAERLRAFTDREIAEFEGYNAYAELVSDQKSLLAAQNMARENQRDILRSKLDQRRITQNSLADKQESIEGQISIINQQMAILDEVKAGQIVSRFDLLDMKADLARAQGELANVVNERIQIAEAIAESEQQILELDSRLRNDSLTELGGVSAELREVDEALGKLVDRVARLKIQSPRNGVVKGLVVKSIGSVVEPGQTLMEIVPLDEIMIAEVQIPPADIGHIEIGQRADVTITTFDVNQFGMLEGRVQRISASTFVNDDGEPYYVGVIELEQNYVGDDPSRHPILPGMIVNADIQTGKKTLLRYLVKPIDRALSNSFTER